jgi:nucleoside-diphosphate-sugar epimerase
VSRVVVVGATGNAGTSVLHALGGDDTVDEIVGVAPRLPETTPPKTTWAAAEVERSDLVSIFRGADCVVHLAWRIQPSHDVRSLRETNVTGSARVFSAAAEARVPALVYASSVGAYSRGPKDRAVDESWPTEGIPTSFYARHKAEVERLLDRFEAEQPDTRVVRMRPALIFKRGSGEEQRRYFLGPLFPRALARAEALPFVPDLAGLRFQAVHADDVADAYRRAVVDADARGAFNVAADPVLDADVLARALDARKVPVPVALARGAMSVTWKLRLQPTPPGWLDMGLSVPVMDVTRARTELGWEPQHSSVAALLELLTGIREGVGTPTPALEPPSAKSHV